MITTKEIADILPEEYTHEMLSKAILSLRGDAFGKISRVDSCMLDGKINKVYHLRLAQAICLITEIDNGKLVWLVREVMALEHKEKIPLEHRVTEEEFSAVDNHDLVRLYKDLTKALHSISATMDMVYVTIEALRIFKEDPSRYGTVSLDVFTDLLTEATDTKLTALNTYHLLVNILKVDCDDSVYLHGNSIVVDVISLTDMLDDILIEAIRKSQDKDDNCLIKRPPTLTDKQLEIEKKIP